jgi:exosortase B
MNVQTPKVQTDSSTAVRQADLIAIGLGLLLMYAPTYIKLDQTVWSVVGQGHGPVMLTLTIWLAWQRWSALTAMPTQSAMVPGGLAVLLGLFMHVIGLSQDLLMIDVTSQLLLLSGLLLLYRGWAGLRHMWFPLFFMVFLIPLPGIIVATVTSPLKTAVSYVAEGLLYGAGFPIGRSGVTLTIGPYQLLVADACAGLNSIFALEAIGVFYMSVVQHAARWRNIALATLIIPVSFVSNVIRVIVLVLITYYLGDEAGQGFIHGFAGILLFMIATALTIGVDSLLGLLPMAKRPVPATPAVAGH